jgi:hypothetical protein
LENAVVSILQLGVQRDISIGEWSMFQKKLLISFNEYLAHSTPKKKIKNL